MSVRQARGTIPYSVTIVPRLTIDIYIPLIIVDIDRSTNLTSKAINNFISIKTHPLNSMLTTTKATNDTLTHIKIVNSL